MPDYFQPRIRPRRSIPDEEVRLTGISREDTVFATIFVVGMLIAAVIRFQGLVWQYYRPMQIF